MNTPLTTRRRVLRAAGGALSATLAGCFQHDDRIGRISTAELSMAAVGDAELASEVLGNTAHPELLDRVVDGGATTENPESMGQPPLPDDERVLYDGTVYRVSRGLVDRTPAHWYRVEIALPQDNENSSDTETIRVSDLPAVDRERVADVEPGVRLSYVYTDAERERSVLVPDPGALVLVWDGGERGEWGIRNERETTMNTYRYTAERIASAAAYGRQIRERFGFALTGLSTAERDIVETAIGQEKYVVENDETRSAAFDALVERFRAHDAVHDFEGGSSGRRYVVEYGESIYWTLVLTPDNESRADTPS